MSVYSSEELLDAGIIYRNKREQLDVTIGDGMELLIRGEENKKNKLPTSSSYNSFGMHQSSTDEYYDLQDEYECDTKSSMSYESHEQYDSYDSESHRGDKIRLNNIEEKKDPAKEDIEANQNVLGSNDWVIVEETNDDKYKEQGSVEMIEGVLEEEKYSGDSCPRNCYKEFPFLANDDETPFWLGWAQLRLKTFQLIENKYFETAVITMILLNCLALTLEDVHLQYRPLLQDILYYMNRMFRVIFCLEMLIKWLALGFRDYFSNALYCMDFIMVMLSLVNLAWIWAGAPDFPAFRLMSTLPRLVSRSESMRVVVNTLVQAIPSIFNVLLACLIFWLVFAIIGVHLFAGKYYKCVDTKGNTLSPIIIPDRNFCLANNYTWKNSKRNFDHVGNAYLCLFQVATFNGWIEIMKDAVDSNNIDGKQPIRENNIHMYFYFVFFIIFGSFFTLNLFVGVIIDNFNEQKKKTGGSLDIFMTEDQRKYYNAMKKMSFKKPLKAIPRPRWKPQFIVFQIVTNKKFNTLIMSFVGFNMLTMALDQYQQDNIFTVILECFNQIFIAIFSIECLLKIFALRNYYFKDPWNLFDFAVIILSLAGMVLSDVVSKLVVSPTLLRVAKVGRVLRLVKGAKGIRTLLFALTMSLPALFNICLLLFLVMFIFAIFGMSFFMNVVNYGGLDDVYNFRTFGQSMILLFMLSTSSGWDAVLDGITNEEDCDKQNLEMGITGSCGSSTLGIAFLLSYLVINYLIVINMYIAVILENFSQATKDVQEGLTDDDYDMYYEIWQHFDPDGTRYIRYDQLSDFLDVLESPLKIHKPNKYKIVSMDIPICKGDLVYCVDILDALTKDFFARKGNPIIDIVAEIGQMQTRLKEARYETTSSSLWRMREVYCAIIIQKSWRKYTMIAKKQPADNDWSIGVARPDGRETAESVVFATQSDH